MRSRPSTLPTKSDARARATSSSYASLRSVSPLPGSSPIDSRPTDGLVDAEAVTGVDRAHLGELHQPLGLHSALAPASSRMVGRRPGNRDRRGDRRPADALDAAHAQQRRGHRGAGVAGGDHRRRLAVAHRLGGAHERGVLLAAHALGGVVVHRDDLGRRDQLEVATTFEVLRGRRGRPGCRARPRRGHRRRSRRGPGRRPSRRRRSATSSVC